jgi:hypothetical protein
MRRATRSSAQDVLSYWEVQTGDAILEKSQMSPAEHSDKDDAECNKQKRSRSLCKIACLVAALVNGNRYVEKLTRFGSVSKLGHQVVLFGGNQRRTSVAHQNDSLLVAE